MKMKDHKLTTYHIKNYGKYLFNEEKSKHTIEKYLRDTIAFLHWLNGRSVTKEITSCWKSYLYSNGYSPVTVNAKLSALNGLLEYLGWSECKVKFLKIQRKLFRDNKRDLSKAEYEKLVYTAKKLKKERLALLMETICSTGIRVSELKYITISAVRMGKAEISLKGKIRTILIPSKLCTKLLNFAQKNKIVSGELFITKSGKSISRKQIWSEMKAVCKKAQIELSKVFPHNLRHLFAQTFYRIRHDISMLADILGHSSIETTRIYLISTGLEHVKTMEMMRLIS